MKPLALILQHVGYVGCWLWDAVHDFYAYWFGPND